MFLYETHLHTSPVSRCAKASVQETVEFYKEKGYAGVFITNHYVGAHREEFPDYESRIHFLFSDYEEAVTIGKEIGISVFFGVEVFYKGADFLVYGLDKNWWLAHPENEDLDVRERLQLFMDGGALVIHAHPYREDFYIDYIRLLPRHVHGVEIYNANRKPLENEMAAIYAEKYGLLTLAGSDNHVAGKQQRFGGVQTDTPITDESDFVDRVKSGAVTLFIKE